MAGSLNHIVDDDGRFTMDSIDNLGDAHEALEECYAIIYHLAGGDSAKVSAVCNAHGFVDPWGTRYGGKNEPMTLAPKGGA